MPFATTTEELAKDLDAEVGRIVALLGEMNERLGRIEQKQDDKG